MAKADAVEVEFSGGERSATRYANSTITANLIEHDQEVTITVRYGQKSASTTVHQFDDASLKRAIAEAQTLAKQRPDNPGADAARQAAAGLRRGRRGAAGGRQLRTGRTRPAGQAERRRLREEGRRRLRLHPEDALDRRARELGRAVRLPPLRRSEPDPDLPDAGRHRIGMGRHDRAEGRDEDRRRRRSAKPRRRRRWRRARRARSSPAPTR